MNSILLKTSGWQSAERTVSYMGLWCELGQSKSTERLWGNKRAMVPEHVHNTPRAFQALQTAFYSHSKKTPRGPRALEELIQNTPRTTLHEPTHPKATTVSQFASQKRRQSRGLDPRPRVRLGESTIFVQMRANAYTDLAPLRVLELLSVDALFHARQASKAPLNKPWCVFKPFKWDSGKRHAPSTELFPWLDLLRASAKLPRWCLESKLRNWPGSSGNPAWSTKSPYMLEAQDTLRPRLRCNKQSLQRRAFPSAFIT